MHYLVLCLLSRLTPLEVAHVRSESKFMSSILTPACHHSVPHPFLQTVFLNTPQSGLHLLASQGIFSSPSYHSLDSGKGFFSFSCLGERRQRREKTAIGPLSSLLLLGQWELSPPGGDSSKHALEFLQLKDREAGKYPPTAHLSLAEGSSKATKPWELLACSLQGCSVLHRWWGRGDRTSGSGS